jgi:HlyD family secretion protein
MEEADDRRDTLESLAVMHGGRSRMIYWFFLLGLIAMIAALPLVRVEVSVGAPGIVTSSGERIPIHAPADGYIKEIKARENQEVRKGDVLLVIESPVLLEKIALNRAQCDIIEKQLADIAMLLSATPDANASGDGVISFDAVKIGAFQTAQYLGQYDLLNTQLVSNEVQLNRSEREHKRALSLHKQGLTSDQDLDDAVFARDTAKTDRQQLVRQSMSLWRTNQLSLQNSLTTNLGEAAQLDRQLETYTIRASEDGVLMGFAGMSPGNYVLGTGKLGDLSPRGDLIVDAYVPPKDIGAVRLGQSVLVQVDCFPYTEWGALKGCVAEISPDLVQNGQQYVFKVKVALESTTLESRATGRVNIGKGMTSRVQLLMQPRTLLQLLYQKTSEWLDPRTRAPGA